MTTRMMLAVFTGLLCVNSFVFGQSGEPDIQKRLEMIEKGQAEQVKAELPTLLTNYQNNPGVMYLQGVLTSDGTEAAKIFQSIVDNFPKSEWADDALYKLYQYYYSIGLYKTADQKLAQLKQDYPFSAYAVEQSSTPKQEAAESAAIVKPKGTVPKFSTSFTVQVGAFSTLPRAEELKNFFETKGYSSNIFTMVSNGKKLHKVWVGEFQNQEDAKRFGVEIKKKFSLESIVVAR
ncbi:MAG TPA: SPOR domain-containing protein [Bacteroidota bacterium]